jgi:23S rRNA (guanosine2251-2'-O)-methyltransferase
MNKTPEVAFGYHAVLALLKKSPRQISKIYLQEGKKPQRLHELVRLAKNNNIPIESATQEALLDLTDEEANHQGLVAILGAEAPGKNKPQNSELDLETLIERHGNNIKLLILDGVQDPHNLGACLRVADTSGIHAVIIPKDNAVAVNATVRKVSSGAAESVPVFPVTNLARTMKMLKDKHIWIYGATEDASQSLYKTKLQPPIAIVMGAEGSGMRRLTQDSCDFLIHIPMLGAIPNLNVSVATGIILFDMLRQSL